MKELFELSLATALSSKYLAHRNRMNYPMPEASKGDNLHYTDTGIRSPELEKLLWLWCKVSGHDFETVEERYNRKECSKCGVRYRERPCPPLVP